MGRFKTIEERHRRALANKLKRIARLKAEEAKVKGEK